MLKQSGEERLLGELVLWRRSEQHDMSHGRKHKTQTTTTIIKVIYIDATMVHKSDVATIVI